MEGETETRPKRKKEEDYYCTWKFERKGEESKVSVFAKKNNNYFLPRFLFSFLRTMEVIALGRMREHSQNVPISRPFRKKKK